LPLDPAVPPNCRRSGRRCGGADGGSCATATANASADSLFDAGEGEDGELLRDFSFSWGAFNEVFGDTPLEDAVTALVTEYAALYARIAGCATLRTAPLTTLDVVEAVSNDAVELCRGPSSTFIGRYRFRRCTSSGAICWTSSASTDTCGIAARAQAKPATRSTRDHIAAQTRPSRPTRTRLFGCRKSRGRWRPATRTST